MKEEDFLYLKGIPSDTTIGIEGDILLTELLKEYAAQPRPVESDAVALLAERDATISDLQRDKLYWQLEAQSKHREVESLKEEIKHLKENYVDIHPKF
jgi:hypothetical protein